MATITQYTSDEAIDLLTRKMGIPVKQADLARILNVSRQYIIQMKNKPLPVKYTYIIDDKIKNQNVDNSVILDYFPDVFGSCGSGVFQFSTKKEQIAIPKNSLFKNFTPEKQYFVINAYGNSMEPFICDKDKLVIESWNGEQIIDNKPYLFAYKDEIFIKRLAKNVNQLIIIPDNKDYDIIKLKDKELEEVNIIGQIVGLMRELR